MFFKSISSRGIWAWILGLILTSFYVVLYWYPKYLGLGEEGSANIGLIAFFDPLSKILNGNPASQWFVYGVFYTFAILLFGSKFIVKYRHSRYQVLRTVSVMFFQLGFAFLIPEIMSLLNPSESSFNKDIKNMWPLNHYFFEEWHLQNMIGGGNLGIFMLLSGLAMIIIISPILTYFYGKRWYCSWVCGCGGLAETAGDSFRQLSDKSLSVWRFERISVHLVTVFVILMTIAVLYSFIGEVQTNFFSRDQFIWGVCLLLIVVPLVIYIFKKESLAKDAKYIMISLSAIIVGVLLINSFSGQDNILFFESYKLRSWYGFLIGAVFSGVIGVGFYPILGSRVWCRFGCPMAAILGLQQRLFSRFRITTNGGQCISCGNCSTYCEMGIDVRAYAQKGENIIRSSCVGCGICSEVCPRGVLKLENMTEFKRYEETPITFGVEGFTLKS